MQLKYTSKCEKRNHNTLHGLVEEVSGRSTKHRQSHCLPMSSRYLIITLRVVQTTIHTGISIIYRYSDPSCDALLSPVSRGR